LGAFDGPAADAAAGASKVGSPAVEREAMLIVGLGNPGPEYSLTPHNLGFLTVDRLADHGKIRVSRPEGNALVGRGEIDGSAVILAKPLSYMNLSGGPIKTLLSKYELELRQLLVIYDELDLPWGTLRLRERGSAAGHNGMISIISALDSQEFLRLRIGIHPGRRVGDGAAYVLQPFKRAQESELDAILGRAADVVRLLLSDGAAKAMAVCNRRAEGSDTEGK
jgi:PTH1 family peptidyl-tRNA hydrolase